MLREEELEVELKLLLSLNHTPAWTGSLDNLRQSSYVSFSEITKLINQKKTELIRLKNGQKRIKERPLQKQSNS
jgi:hypothetical protein